MARHAIAAALLAAAATAFAPLSVPRARVLPRPSAVEALEFEDAVCDDIASEYLINKYRKCDADGESNCRLVCSRADVRSLLHDILPPIRADALEVECDAVMSAFAESASDDDIDAADFVAVVRNNKYWAEAGELVVKELMYLDALQANYYDKKLVLSDGLYVKRRAGVLLLLLLLHAALYYDSATTTYTPTSPPLSGTRSSRIPSRGTARPSRP